MTSASKLHFTIDGDGTDLVVLHPVGLDHSFMGALLDGTRKVARVIDIDLRGHGQSPAAHDGITLQDYVADIHAVVERVCRGPAVVLGLSFGGMLAQLYALAHPQSVRGLLLSGCSGGFAPEIRPHLRERGLAAMRGGMGAVVDATLERWFTPAFRADPEVDRVRERLLSNDPANWSAAWHAMSTFDAFPRLSEIAVPTRVIAGEIDAGTPLPAAQALCDAIPGAYLTVLEGAPHMMQIECRAAFDSAVSAFLAEHEKMAGR